MGLPYETPPMGGLTTVSPGKVIVPMSIPSRARIHSLRVERTDIAATGSFTVDVYNNEDAANGNTVEDEDGNTVSAAIFKIMPQIAGTNGSAHYYADAGTGGFGFPFFSQDTPAASDPPENKRIVWLVITATAGWVFCAIIGTETDMI